MPCLVVLGGPFLSLYSFFLLGMVERPPRNGTPEHRGGERDGRMLEGARGLSNRLGAGSEGIGAAVFGASSPTHLRRVRGQGRGTGSRARGSTAVGRLMETDTERLANDNTTADQTAFFDVLLNEGLQESVASTDRAPGVSRAGNNRPAATGVNVRATAGGTRHTATTSAPAHADQLRRLSDPPPRSNRTQAELARDAAQTARFQVRPIPPHFSDPNVVHPCCAGFFFFFCCRGRYFVRLSSVLTCKSGVTIQHRNIKS